MANVTPQPAPAPAPQPEDDKNVFTQLFGQEQGQKNTNILNATAAQEKQQTAFFGSSGAPQTVPTRSRKTRKRRQFKSGRSVLQVSILFILLSASFFYSQNALGFEWFGANIAQRADLAEVQADQLQADVNVRNHLTAVLLLDHFTQASDEYYYALGQLKSRYTSQNKKDEFEKNSVTLRIDMQSSITQLQGVLTGNLDANASLTAKEVIDDSIRELEGKSGEVDEETLNQEIRDLETARLLIQSKALQDAIRAFEPEEAKDSQFEDILEQYNAINENKGAMISKIQKERLVWSSYFTEAEAVIKSVDPLFNTEFEGNLSIRSISFSAQGSLIISGDTVTDDSKNFTLISNLIDAFEASPSFMDVDERSFSKSEGSESYSGSFQISMTTDINL
jgi:hypothetical protein